MTESGKTLGDKTCCQSRELQYLGLIQYVTKLVGKEVNVMKPGQPGKPQKSKV